MDYNKLRTFTVVAEHQSITRAAELLYRTQPAISNQLKDLEAILGVTLFERKNGKIFLTREGEMIQQEAVRQLGAIDDAILRIKDDRENTKGVLKIAIETDSVGTILPEILKGFKQLYPLISFDIVSSTYGEIDQLLLENKVDFSFQVLYTHKEFFHCEPIATFTRSLVATKEYLECSAPISSITDLAEHNLLAFYSATGDIRHWLKINNQSKHVALFERRQDTTVVKDAYTLNEMLFAGLGVGFAFDNMAGLRNFKDQQLIPLLPEYRTMQGTLDLAYRKVQNERYICEAFRHYVVENREKWDKFAVLKLAGDQAEHK